MLQIRNPDRKDNLLYRIGYLDRVQMIAGNTEPMSTFGLYEVKHVELEVPETTSMLKTDWFYVSETGNLKNDAELVLKGKGKIYPSGYGENASQADPKYRMSLAYPNITLEGNVTVGKNMQWPDLHAGTNPELPVVKKFTSNGYQVSVERFTKKDGKVTTGTGFGNYDVKAAMQAGDVVARTAVSDVNVADRILDATDFRLVNKEEQNNLYLTAETTGSEAQVKVVQLGDSPTAVTYDDGTQTLGRYNSYKEAFGAIYTAGVARDYIITNETVEMTFDPYDENGALDESTQTELSKITPQKANSLTFESGTRAQGSRYEKSGNRYEIRIRHQKLEMPEGVPVTFRNAVIKYDQGTQATAGEELTIVGNGGKLAFEDCVFLKAGDADMYPIIYGGSTGAKGAAASDIVVSSSKDHAKNDSGYNYQFTAIYNYDSLQVSSKTEVKTEFNAQKGGEVYTGETKIATGAELVLSGKNSVKKIGSLKGASDVSGGRTAPGILKIARPDTDTGVAVTKDNTGSPEPDRGRPSAQ